MTQTLRFCSWNIQVGMKRTRVLDVFPNHADFRNLDLLALQEASAHVNGDDASQIALALGEGYSAYQHAYHQLKMRPQANALVWNTKRIHFDAIEHHILPTYVQAVVTRTERAVLNRLK